MKSHQWEYERNLGNKTDFLKKKQQSSLRLQQTQLSIQTLDDTEMLSWATRDSLGAKANVTKCVGERRGKPALSLLPLVISTHTSLWAF